MARCPVSRERIQSELEAVNLDPVPAPTGIDGAADRDDRVSQYEALLRELQSEFAAQLDGLLAAAYNPEYKGIELVAEDRSRYYFRVSPEFWHAIQDDFGLAEDVLWAVKHIFESCLDVPAGWAPVVVAEPQNFHKGKQAIISELRALVASGMDADEAVEFITEHRGAVDSLNPESVTNPERAADLADVPRWSDDLKDKAKTALLRTPSGVRENPTDRGAVSDFQD